jgi:hypothetical protein
VSTSGFRGTTGTVIALLTALLALDSGCRAAPATPPAAPIGPDPLATGSHGADPGPPGAVLTQRGDETRLGWYSRETRLTVGSVGGGHFGKVANLDVDGEVYAQPIALPRAAVTLTVARTRRRDRPRQRAINFLPCRCRGPGVGSDHPAKAPSGGARHGEEPPP